MRVEDIEIHAGSPSFEYEPLRRVEAKCEATTAFSAAPTVEEVNGRLRALAAKLGANAVINVAYKSGASLTSWKSLKATGLAVHKLSDETACEVCAETIKKAALKCRFCGAERTPTNTLAVSPVADGKLPVVPLRPEKMPDESTVYKPQYQDGNKPGPSLEPLRDTNNPQIIVWVMAGIFILALVLAGAS